MAITRITTGENSPSWGASSKNIPLERPGERKGEVFTLGLSGDRRPKDPQHRSGEAGPEAVLYASTVNRNSRETEIHPRQVLDVLEHGACG